MFDAHVVATIIAPVIRFPWSRRHRRMPFATFTVPMNGEYYDSNACSLFPSEVADEEPSLS